MADAALFLHLVGALLFVGGIIAAGIAQTAARRRRRAGEVALLLAVARTGVSFVAVGAVLVLAFGVWLLDLRDHSVTEAWIAASLTLLALALVRGALGGRRPRQARFLAGDWRATTVPLTKSCAGCSTIVPPLMRTTPRPPPPSRSSL